jgi:alpha-beta hydrolase superfamily lysophospholipase
VSEVVALDGRFEIAASIVAPTDLDDTRGARILCCLPGGFLSRAYFDLLVPHGPGSRASPDDHRFSFAEAMAERGFVTLAFDHLGVGESSRPHPIEGGYELGVEAVARANQRALELALEQLAQGDPEHGLPALREPVTIGVGHSMGSMLTVEQQALARPHRALVLFSFSTRGTPAFLDDSMREYANDPERLRREIGRLARRSMGSPYPERANDSEENRRAAFGVGTAPQAAEDALHAAATNLLAVGGLASMVPGGFAPAAERIDVPVFMWVGDHDLHDDRHTRSELPRSPAVTTRILEDCWHCHFVANTRETLWRETAEWLQATLATCQDVPGGRSS